MTSPTRREERNPHRRTRGFSHVRTLDLVTWRADTISDPAFIRTDKISNAFKSGLVDEAPKIERGRNWEDRGISRQRRINLSMIYPTVGSVFIGSVEIVDGTNWKASSCFTAASKYAECMKGKINFLEGRCAVLKLCQTFVGLTKGESESERVKNVSK